jgi:hypothetical protein
MSKAFAIAFMAAVLGAVASNTSSTYNVAFTHCGSGRTCGGHQKCSHYELALSDAYLWDALVGQPMSGGYDHCPGGNWKSCCSGSHSGVCSKLPSCPLDHKNATRYPVCVKASNGNQETAYVTGCCPSRHPCNICKTEKHEPGGCSATKDQADLCDNLWHALGSPRQSTGLQISIGACGPSPRPPSPSPTPSGPCKDVPPDTKHSCEQQKGWGKCGASFMKGHCCKTCFGCRSGCGGLEDDVVV